MNQMSDTQKSLIAAARCRLENKTWFKGICLDGLPSDKEIQEDFEGCLMGVIFETELWDNPELFNL